MKSCLTLTANVALFAFWSVAVTASPINSVIDRISGHDTAGAKLVAAMMREMDINNRNQETFKDEFDTAFSTFKSTYGIVDDNKLEDKSDANDQIVCKDHEAQLSTLENDLKAKWNTVDAALTAKVTLLGQIRGLLDNEDDDDNQGLHCGENKSAGAGELCTLLDQLEGKCGDERTILTSEETIINDYIQNIGRYRCECKMGEWGEWSECSGDSIKNTIVWYGCNETEKEDSETNLACKNQDAKCGTGTQFVSRLLEWAPKNSDTPCPAAEDQATETIGDENVLGDLSALSDGTQTFTRSCVEGRHTNGECPVDCVWGAWDGEFEDQACDVDSCTNTNGDRKTNTRSVTRGKTTEKAYGGKPCFAIQDGAEGSYWTDTKSETCEYEDAVVHEKAQLVHEKTKLTTKAEKLMKAMCKGDNGPCQHDGTCRVEYSTDDEDVTNWCECSDGYTGDWCEKESVKWGKSTNMEFTGKDNTPQGVLKLDKDTENAVEECKKKCEEKINSGVHVFGQEASNSGCDGFEMSIDEHDMYVCEFKDVTYYMYPSPELQKNSEKDAYSILWW